MLIWAIGLLLVDNAHLGDAAERATQRKSDGRLVIAPPALAKATGALVQPLFIEYFGRARRAEVPLWMAVLMAL